MQNGAALELSEMKKFIGGGTKVSPDQIRLRQLFTVERILSARGLNVGSESSAKDTLLQKNVWEYADLNLVFEIFNDPASRRDLLAFIEHGGYLPLVPRVRQLTSQPEFVKDRQRYSSTFEWFVGELLVRQFMAFSSSFGVTVEDVLRNSDNGTAGDYDVLSVLGDMSLLYLECKTGACSQKSILNSIERSIALHSVACVVFLGTDVQGGQLRAKLTGCQHPRFRYSGQLATIAIKSLPDSQVFQWFDTYFVTAGEQSGNVEAKLRTVMRVLAAHRSSVFETQKPRPEEYAVMGYDYSEESLEK